MSADTGVGPCIASGSHTYSGSCADLPHAPTKNRRQMAVAVVDDSPLTAPALSTSAYCNDPNAVNTRNTATMKPQSPTRLVTNAFLPALRALSRSNQNEIRKYEQAPTPSQPRNM